MFIFDRWPFTNIHELNLDWILRTLRDILDDMKKLSDDLSELSDRVDHITTHGLPEGGTAAQVLTKVSSEDYDAAWETLPEYREVPSATTEQSGKVLTTDGEGGYAWETPQSGNPVPDASDEPAGDVLTTDGAGGYAWETPQSVNPVPDASDEPAGRVLTTDGDGNYEWDALPYPSSRYDPKSYTIQLPVTAAGATATLTGAKAAVCYDAAHTFGTLLVSFEKYTSAATSPYIGIPVQRYIAAGGDAGIKLLYVDTSDNSIKLAGTLHTGLGGAEMTFEAAEAITTALYNTIHIKWLAAGDDDVVITPTP